MKSKENYLDRVPIRNESISWSEENKNVTLEIENKGLMNKIAQRLFKKPKISFVHLDEMGSFIWPILDGKRSIFDLGVLIEERFGEASHPLYERLSQYLRILESYNLITWKKD